jgi:membrane-associated phospholipid phosphatase
VRRSDQFVQEFQRAAVQFRRTWHTSGRWLPNGWLDAVRQLALFAGAYYLYRIVRGLVDGQAGLAFENAREIVNFERTMGLFFEPGLQSWARTQADWIVTIANFMYVNSHFVLTTTFLIWLYIARNQAFYFVRNMFMVAMGLALVGYVVFPTAPPRYLPEWGFSDTVADWVGSTAETSANVLYNPFAAVPSMHVAFALMIGVPAAMLVRNRLLKVLWLIYPLVVSFVVVVTGNHFWMDAALGALVAAISAWAATSAFARLRPEAWGWQQRAAKVTT